MMPEGLHFTIAIVLSLLLAVVPPIMVVVACAFAIRWFVRQERTAKDPESVAVRRSLAEALRSHRKRCGMTQELVAQKVGVSRQAVSKWEQGASEPSTSNLIKLAHLFGVDAADLLRGVGD